MKNWVKYVKERPDWIIQNIARWRFETLNFDPMTNEPYNANEYKCSNGKIYFWPGDAYRAEIEWLKQEAEDDD